MAPDDVNDGGGGPIEIGGQQGLTFEHRDLQMKNEISPYQKWRVERINIGTLDELGQELGFCRNTQ